MKTIFTSLMFISLLTHATEVSFVGPCERKPIASGELGPGFATVGDLTVHFLKQNGIAFRGDERGLVSLFNTPVGDGALEVISDTELRAFGWCYFVDGVGPDVFADEYQLASTVKKVEWIYGYAHYKSGDWVSQCAPAYLVRPGFLCE